MAMMTAAALVGAATLAALGIPAGLSSVRAQRVPNQAVNGFPVQAHDHFGWSFAAGDFDGDGRDELVTGIPNDDGLNDVSDGGGLIVSQYLPPAALTPVKFVRQSAGLDPPEVGDRFGEVLASCDFNADGFDDLAVGMPHENFSGTQFDGRGAVQTHYGRAAGLPGFGSEFFTQDTAGIPGDAEEGDAFGDSLACGDFDGDGRHDLAIGVPGENLGSEFGAGMIEVLPGWSGGLASDLAYAIDQNSSGIDGSAETGDFFGGSLAAGNFDGDGFVDLAIGVVNEDDVGAVQILYGSVAGLNGSRDLFWYDENVGGTREAGDFFGLVLVAGDFDGDGFDDLAIGVPYEEAGTVGNDIDSGEVKIAYGAAGGFGTLPARTQRFTQDALYGAGASQPGDQFGWALATGDFDADGRDDLAVGTPGEFWTGPADGLATVLLGGEFGLHFSRYRGFVAGLEGIPGNAGEHNENFSWSLAAGDFDGDGHDDLAIGSPYEDASGFLNSGSQMILYGALFADGFGTGNSAFWSAVGP
jgi:hypothetical protein